MQPAFGGCCVGRPRRPLIGALVPIPIIPFQGIIVLLLRTVDSLQRLYDMTMDVHARYRTEAHKDVVCRFNERFLLSLKEMPHCTANCSYIFGTVAMQPPHRPWNMLSASTLIAH